MKSGVPWAVCSKNRAMPTPVRTCASVEIAGARDIRRQKVADFRQGFGVRALIVGEAKDVGIRKFADQVSFAQLDRIDPEFDCDLVHQPFLREHCGRTADAAIGADGAFVGRDAAIGRFVSADVIRPGQHFCDHAGIAAGRERPNRIGADIDRDVRLEAQNLAFRGHIGFEGVDVLAGMDAGDEMLAPIFDPLHGAAGANGEPRQQYFFGEDMPFDAEPAADLGRNDVDPVLRPAQFLGEIRPQEVRNLGRRPDRQDLGRGIECCDDAAAFERHARLPLIAIGAADDVPRLRLRRSKIAASAGLLDEQIAAPAFEQGRCAGRKCGRDVGHNRQRLVRDID